MPIRQLAAILDVPGPKAAEMTPIWLYYIWATLLLVLNAISSLLNLVSLPGNWLIVVFTALFAWLVRTPDGQGVSWAVVGVVVGLAILAELVESLAGMAGAARQGASRRGLALALVGSIVGSIVGAVLGLPIPIVGSALAAVFGGALGAFIGAALGEDWKGRTLDESLAVGSAAFWGRLLGTAGKLIVGVVMVVVVTIDSLF